MRSVSGINNTFIALIPRVDSPQKLNDFRPISLVGGMYKILPKLLSIDCIWLLEVLFLSLNPRL